jgi:hypothetical protein
MIDDGPRGRPEATMTSGIPGSGGPGGAGGAGGPGSPGSIDGADEAEAAVESGAPLEVHAARPAAAGGAAAGTGAVGGTSAIDRIAADLDAGRISGREALDRLIDEAVPDEAELGPADRAELREAMLELIANDPHLQALAARIGAGSPKGDD